MILITTNHPYVRVGCHNWYQIIMSIIRCVWPYFQKTTVRKHLDGHIRTIVVLTGGKLTEFYFLPLLYVIYYSITTHLWQGKNVSFLLPGDVNLGPVHSRWSLLEDSLYHVVGLCACRAIGHDHTPRAWGPRNVLWMPSARHEYVLIMYAVMFVQR
jgi:hypothetical protein